MEMRDGEYSKKDSVRLRLKNPHGEKNAAGAAGAYTMYVHEKGEEMYTIGQVFVDPSAGIASRV